MLPAMRLVQLSNGGERRVAIVHEPLLLLLDKHRTIYDLCTTAMTTEKRLVDVAETDTSRRSIDYDPVYSGRSDWRLLPSLDHPHDPAHCLVTGTGLTHLASARAREAMHTGGESNPDETDSLRMYRLGLEGGQPEPDSIGVQPEWFYKGHGTILRAHGEPLEVPNYADDGGDEPEVAGLYIVDPGGTPRRVGMTAANEFSDHIREEQNYLYLAASELRTASIGPEAVLIQDFDDIRGSITIFRDGGRLWSKSISTGHKNMTHSLANLEHHHFKYPEHRVPGDVHVHFLGADTFSYAAEIQLEESDVMEVSWTGFGRPLRNSVSISREEPAIQAVMEL